MYLSREIVELVSSSIILLTVLLLFIKSLENRNNISLIDVSIWITGISFGLAPFILILYGGQFPEAKIITVIQSYIGILLFIAGLLLIKKYFIKPKARKISLISIINNVQKIKTKQVFLFYTAFFIVRLIFAFDYGIFGSGTATSERMSSLPYVLFVSRSLLDLIFWGCLFWSITKILIDKKLILLPASIIIIETLLIFFRGRRQMLYFLFLFLYIYILLGYRINLRVFIPSIVILVVLVNIIFPAFISFREVYLQESKRANVIDSYKYSYFSLSQAGIDEYRYESNVAQRVYINNWNIEIINKSSLGEGTNGQALAMCVLWVVPSPFLPNKGLLKDPEMLINYNLGLSILDSPSNWPAYGLADFGLPGAFLYGIILGLVLYLFQYFAKYNFKKFPFFSFIILGSVTFLAFFIEETPVAVFSVIRDTMLLYLIFNVLFLFIRKKTQRKFVS